MPNSALYSPPRPLRKVTAEGSLLFFLKISAQIIKKARGTHSNLSNYQSKTFIDNPTLLSFKV